MDYYSRRMKYFGVFLVLALSAGVSDSNECFGTNNELSLQKNKQNYYEKLKERYTNCTIVRGNLELTGIEMADVEFLKDIEVVTGYVICALNMFSYLPLEKLKIIRGQELYKGQYALYIAANNKNSNILPNGLRELRLKSLTEIQRGAVYLKQNKRLCFGETIAWNDILNPKLRQYFKWNVTIEVDRLEGFNQAEECGACHPSCNGRCWGNGEDMCQTLTLNCSLSCGDSRCRGPEAEDCCDRECAAGCTGPTDRDCIVCRHVNNSGVCESSCPPKMLYDQLEARRVPNPDFKYHYHDQCVDTCPSNLLVEDNSCVKSCRNGQIDDGNGVCVPCTPELCKKECYGVGNKGGMLGNAVTVDSSNIQYFDNCTIIQGNVVFQAYAFKGDDHKGVAPLTSERLRKAFEKVRVITGYLEILSWPEDLIDFSVFGNLEEIQGVDLFRDVVALVIQDSINDQGPFNLAHVESLGFRSLVSIKHGNVYMGYLKKLCYAKTVSWNNIIEHPKPYKSFPIHGALFRFLPSIDECDSCDPRCSSNGCWGPSEFDCLACKHFTHDGECFETCPKERGLYPDNNDMTCKECHVECNGTCVGPGQANCTSCKHYDEDGVCVEECSMYRYPDPITGDCTPCHSDCSPLAEKWSAPLCSGPNNTLGINGCESCHTVLMNRNFHVQHCIEPHGICPEAYFESEGVSQSLRSCVPCYDGCTNCTGSRREQCYHTIPADNAEILTAIVVTIVVIIVIFGVIFCFWFRKKEMKKRRANSMRALGLDSQLPNDPSLNPKGCLVEPMTPSGVPPNQAQLRIMKDTELNIGKILGSGAFGTVHKGYWIPSLAGREKVKVPVAIKVLRDDSSHFASTEILDEAFLMASCEHPNLVRLLGISLSQRIMLITQLMPLGNLLEYVRDNKDNIQSHHLLNWCSQIAQGMNYLSKEKHLVHRDLAARNVLVKSPNHVRITDFGLAKLLDVNEDVYRAEGGKMPIKWLALESIQRREFTHKSDVWSYGVTAWELMTFGKKPYENVPAREVHKLLEKGERLMQPSICTIDVYMVMIKCWTVDVDARPSFQELVDEFSKMARDPSRYLVIKNDGEMTDLPSPTNSEFLRKWADEDGGDFDLQDAEQYLNPTTDDITVPAPKSRFSLQPAPHKAQWRHYSGENGPRSVLPYGRLNTTSTEGSSADNRLDSAMTTMTGLPSVAGSMYPNGTSTPFPSVTGHSSPGTPNCNIVPSLTNPINPLYLQDEQPGTSGLTNHNDARGAMRNHSDSSDVFYNPAYLQKSGHADNNPWELQSNSRLQHPAISRAREDSANQRYSAEPILFRQQSRPNDSDPEASATELVQDENGYLEPALAANIKPEYLDPCDFPPSPYTLGQQVFFAESSGNDKNVFENPEYEPTFSPHVEIISGEGLPKVKYSATDGDGYEIPMSTDILNNYQNIDTSTTDKLTSNSTYERNGSQSGSSMSSEKRDSGMQSEGDEDATRNEDDEIKLVPKQYNTDDVEDEFTNLSVSENTVVENPNYDLLENMTTCNGEAEGAYEGEAEYMNDPNHLLDPNKNYQIENETSMKQKNPKNLRVNCPSDEEDDIFITPEARRKHAPYSKLLENGESVQGYSRTYSEPDSGVGIEIGLDNLLYHRLGSTGYEGTET